MPSSDLPKGKLPKGVTGGAGNPEDLEWLHAPGEFTVSIQVMKLDQAGHLRTKQEALAIVRKRMVRWRSETAPKLSVEDKPDSFLIRRVDGRQIKMGPAVR